MNKITLCSNQSTNVTVISNIFIDHFMPRANGSYVKVYLYLLRCLTNGVTDLTICHIADCLDDTEKDILRALNYWEKVHLITLVRNSNQEIENILLNDLNTLEYESNDNPITEYAASSSALQVENTLISPVTKPVDKKILSKPNTVFDKPTYTPSQVEALTNTDEIKWLLNIIEIYLERLLKPTDVQLILYLYESLGFSTDLIMYLYEYCVSKNKKNASYIETVALSWAEEGIDTVEKAENATVMYNSNYNAVNKAFGLNRSPGTVERQYINKWLKKFGFSIEIVVEACNRTILRTQKPDFNYADKILENWHKHGVKHLSDIKKLDEAHTKSTRNQQAQGSAHGQVNTTQKPIKNNNNRFNAFPQRNYTQEDYSSMEEKLLNKYLGGSKNDA